MQKLLITYGTRPLAQRLAKQWKDKFELHYATSEEVPSFLQATYPQIPTGVNPTFAHELLKLCLDQQIDFVLPLGESEINALAEAKQLFEEYDITAIVPAMDNLPLYFILDNPSSELMPHLYVKGKSLDGAADLKLPATGLLLVSDNQEELALITV